MGMEIITGYTGTRHITPGMDAAVWRSIYGEDMYIVNEGNLCAGSMPSINEFTILDGVVDMQGHMGYGTQETLSIDTCTTGFKRIDLICCRYTHNNITFVDNMEYIVLKGIEVQAPNEPMLPAYNTGIIDEGATIVDFPMYRVNLNGADVTFTQLAEVRNVGKEYTAGNYLRMNGTTFSIPITEWSTSFQYTLPNNSMEEAEFININKGLYFFNYSVTFSANPNGSRYSALYINRTPTLARQRTMATPTGDTIHSGSDTFLITEDGTGPLYLRLFQNGSGQSPMNVTLSFRYRRIEI